MGKEQESIAWFITALEKVFVDKQSWKSGSMVEWLDCDVKQCKNWIFKLQ